MEVFHGSTIIFYRRYVGNTFCFKLFHSKYDAIIFFDLRHLNIRFTMEKSVNHKLTFLDVLIINKNPNFSLTIVYRQKIFTGLYIN